MKTLENPSKTNTGLIIEKKEFVLIKRCINFSIFKQNHQLQRTLLQLSRLLESATIVSEEEMPEDLVRLNSIITIESNQMKKSYQLSLHLLGSGPENNLALFSDLGSAVIGKRKGEKLLVKDSSGEHYYKIIAIKQSKSNISLDMLL